jgi:hypothetical protein
MASLGPAHSMSSRHFGSEFDGPHNLHRHSARMNEDMTVDEFNALRGKRKDFAKPARPKPERGVMNKTEQRMAADLALEKACGAIRWWGFEAVKIRLADKTWYTPDFCIIHNDGSTEFRETKGHWEDDARVKFKVAAELFPWALFTAYKRVEGGWDFETMKPRNVTT